MAVAIVCAAAAANAASLRWSLSDFTASVSGSPNGYTALIFAASDSSDTVTTLALATAQEYAAAGKFTELNAAKIAEASLASDGSVTTAYHVESGWKKNTIVETYAIVFDNADLSQAKFYAVGLDPDESPAAPSSVKFSTDSKQVTGYLAQSGSWTAVAPEPTSGLLMLVGLGALALRRRRA